MTDFSSLYAAADAAGKSAAQARTPTPMVVGQAKDILSNEIDFSQPVYVEEAGVCGFAWIKLKGNEPFGRWAKKAGLAKPAYPTGLMIWVSAYGQSMEKKEAYARAFASVLSQSGVTAYADSRMD